MSHQILIERTSDGIAVMHIVGCNGNETDWNYTRYVSGAKMRCPGYSGLFTDDFVVIEEPRPCGLVFDHPPEEVLPDTPQPSTDVLDPETLVPNIAFIEWPKD